MLHSPAVAAATPEWATGGPTRLQPQPGGVLFTWHTPDLLNGTKTGLFILLLPAHGALTVPH